MHKKNILFIGSFKKKANDGSVGGQMFACSQILNSDISQYVNWTLIDSTAESNTNNYLFVRMSKAFKRFITFLFFISIKHYHSIIIFSANGASFWEKGTLALIAKKLTKSKVIFAPRSGFIINEINSKGYFANFIKFVFNQVDIIICQSEFWKKYFKNKLTISNLKKYIIIENFLEFSSYHELEITDFTNTPEILFLSWVDANKGIFELIEACKLLKDDGLSFRLTIAGDGSASEEVRRRVKLYNLDDFVKSVGWVLGFEKIILLKKSNIYVLPSYAEGYPNSLMEAMASGKACVASNVGSIPDMITHESNGLLISPKNSIDLYYKLKDLILDKEKVYNLSLNARYSIKSKNSYENFISSFKKILDIHP
jgi:glycosyltransferase involved in cell wall biosynthesis